jgi:hypothetical protein
MTRRALALAVPLLLIELWPLITGALSPPVFWPLFVGASTLTLYALGARSARAGTAALAVVSAALTLDVSDLALRYLPFVTIPLSEPWPRMPLVTRFIPNLHFEGYRYSDLGRMAGVKEWREPKDVRVITDSAGFRNEGLDPDRPLDVVLLGDSFGAGAVTQDDTWTGLLSRVYGLNAYNLSSPGAGPWHEYVNLSAEKDRLKVRQGGTLIWELFTGNDLDDGSGPLDLSALPWHGPIETWRTRINEMRTRSPVRRLLTPPNELLKGDVADRQFLNGRTILFYKPYMERTARSSQDIIENPNFGHMRALIPAVKSLAASRDLRLVIVLIPSKEEVYSWAWKGAAPWTSLAAPSSFAVGLAGLCRDAGVPFLDAKPYLVPESRRLYEDSGLLLYWYDDTHMNAAGNRFVVSLIHRELLRP